MEAYEVRPVGPVRASVRPPGSKSITNRALVCAALAEGRSVLHGALDSDDTRVMLDGLGTLGVAMAVDVAEQTVHVNGCGGRLPAAQGELFVGNSGTTLRFLTAVATLGRGTFRLDGTRRMRERPVEDLLDTLRALGADAVSELETGCPPVVVRADGLAGGRAQVRGDVSSQFLTGLLLAAPYARDGVTLDVDGPLVSQPYVDMTLAVMRSFGVDVERAEYQQFVVRPARYRGTDYAVEPDASAASYFFAAAAITGGSVTVHGFSRRSLQGDVAFVDVLARMGCRVEAGEDSITVHGGPLHGIRVDMNAISDTVQTLGAVALFASGPTTITGVGHIRHKETDRIGNLAIELRKLGATVEESDDGLTIHPGPLRAARIATYDDHRMAMSLALAGLRTPGVVILDPGCTAKTYPRYFEDLERLSGSPA